MHEKASRHSTDSQAPHQNPVPAFSDTIESPIHTSTPPVTIIGSQPRVSGGFRLSDR
jgi:hypothetical protein